MTKLTKIDELRVQVLTARDLAADGASVINVPAMMRESKRLTPDETMQLWEMMAADAERRHGRAIVGKARIMHWVEQIVAARPR